MNFEYKHSFLYRTKCSDQDIIPTQRRYGNDDPETMALLRSFCCCVSLLIASYHGICKMASRANPLYRFAHPHEHLLNWSDFERKARDNDEEVLFDSIPGSFRAGSFFVLPKLVSRDDVTAVERWCANLG